MDRLGKEFSFITLPPILEIRTPSENTTNNEVKTQEAEEKTPNSTSDSVKSDNVSTTSEDDIQIPGLEGKRQKLRELMANTTYQMVIIGLVLTDMIMVVGQLMVDLQGSFHTFSFILHCLSLFILSLFTFEIIAKLFAYGMDFFSHKFEVFDALVVIVALVLDIVYLHASDAHSATGLIVVLRLWRLVRIQNAMMLQVRRVEEEKVKSEKKRRQVAESQLEKCKAYIATLQELLSVHCIPFEAQDL